MEKSDTGQDPRLTDLTPFIEQLAPSTRKILDEQYHASFVHVIPPK